MTLRELNVRTIPGEGPRRWFSSPNMDLIVWTDPQGAPAGFQLCYDKQMFEHALTWTAEAGLSHMAVDTGESRPARYKGAPILKPGLPVDVPRLLDQFRRESSELPGDYASFVEGVIERSA